MKYNIYQKLHNSNGHTFSFIPHVCYFFISPQYCCFRSSEFNNTLIYQNEGVGLGWGQGQSQEHQHPCPILLEFRHSSASFCKINKKPEVEHARHVHWPRALYFPYADTQNIISFIKCELVRTLYSVGLLSSLSGNNNTSLFSMLVKLFIW